MDPVRSIAETVLFPAAMEIDSAPIVDRRYLDLLAEAGLYDLPTDPQHAGRIIEALGGASLAAAFVWIQHHSAVRAVSASTPEIADRWLAALRAGDVRAGIAYAALRRPGPPSARVDRRSGGWTLNGYAPWVTGWGLVDVILVGARTGDRIVWLLLDAEEGRGQTVSPVRLAALQASSTVEIHWTDLAVDDSRVVAVESFQDWRTRDGHGSPTNGYLAVGVAARCGSLLGSTALLSEVDRARSDLDQATPETVATARAEASLLAVRAASALVVAQGGRAVEADQHSARLMREATFLLVFGQTAAIRAAQMKLLT